MNTNSSKSNLSDLSLNPTYVFENFVVSNSNQFAYELAKNICENNEKCHQLYIIVGKSGLGKTHLTQAIANCFQEQGQNVMYVTAEKFCNEYVKHLKNQTMDWFKEKYRNCDLLIFEDIQFLNNKETTQKEVFYTVEELLVKGKQVIFTSNSNPINFRGFEERLLGKLKSAVIAEIESYDLDTKFTIAKQKATLLDIELDNKILEYISNSIDSNIYEIEGKLSTLKTYSQLMGKSLDLKSVEKILAVETIENLGNKMSFREEIEKLYWEYHKKLKHESESKVDIKIVVRF